MIIVTARLPKKKFALGVAVISALCCCVMAWGASQGASSNLVKTERERQDYLAQWGWQVSETPSVEELLIPTVLDQSYTEYLALQEAQGFPSLTEMTGERVKRYSYQVTNYPTGEPDVQVNLLIYQDQVVAGEVFSPQVDGFIHGLSRPTQT